MTSLGERLKAINAQTKAQQAEKLLREKAEADAKFAAEVETIRQFFMSARSHVERAIEAGRAPTPFKLGRGNHNEAASILKTYKWPNKPIGGTELRAGAFWPADFFSLWLEFERWLTENDLSAEFDYCYDGGGIESWYELVVTPPVI